MTKSLSTFIVLAIIGYLIFSMFRRRGIIRQCSDLIAKDKLDEFKEMWNRHTFLHWPAYADDILFICCWKGARGILGYLVDSGVNINVVNSKGQTLLHWLLPLEGRQDIVEKLVAAGITVTTANAEGWTPLHVAARFGDVQSVKLFLARGADPEARNNENDTPRDLAVKMDRQEVLKIFVDHAQRKNISTRA